MVTLDLLDEKALIRILKEPKNAIIKQYRKLFELDEVELEFTDDAVEMIAKQAIERKTGARGLRSILEKALMDVMFEIPSDDAIGRCIITKETVEGKAKPKIIYRDDKKQMAHGLHGKGAGEIA